MSALDVRDVEILEARRIARDARDGPRVGDWIAMPDGSDHRITHDWGDHVQTGRGDCGSFYLGAHGASYSGSLDPGVPKSRLRSTPETRDGRFWFFHHDWHQAHNGVECRLPCRVFRLASEDA